VCKEETLNDQDKDEVEDGDGAIKDTNDVSEVAEGDHSQDGGEGKDNGDTTVSEAEDNSDSTESDAEMRERPELSVKESEVEVPSDEDADLSQQTPPVTKRFVNPLLALVKDREADANKYAVITSPWKDDKGPKYPGLEISRPGVAVPTAGDACLVPLIKTRFQLYAPDHFHLLILPVRAHSGHGMCHGCGGRLAQGQGDPQ
jgi:hypothetical protein